ncbi:glutamate receptor, partial [Genlisea aurea]
FLFFFAALKYMETDVVAIIGPQSSVVAHTVLQIADEFTTPFLSLATDPTLSPIQFPYFVRTTHSDRHQMTAVADVVYHYGWKKVTVIFVDDDYGRNGLAALEDALDRKQCLVSYKAKILPGDPTEAQVMDVLVKVALMESRVVVLHLHYGAGAKVFSVAQYLGMLSNGYVWIATEWLAAALDSAPHLAVQAMTSNLQGVLVLRPHTPDSARKNAVSAEWNKLARGGSLGLNAFGLYAYDTVWLLAHAIDSFLNQGGNVSHSADSKLKFFEGGKLHLEKMLIFDGGPLLLKNILNTEFVGLTGVVKFTPDVSLVNPAYEILNVIGTGLHRVGYWLNGSGISATAPGTRTRTRSRSNALKSVVWPGESVRTPRGWVFPTDGKLLRIGVPRRAFFGEFVSQVGDTNGFRGFCIDVFVSAVNLLPYAVPYEFAPFGNGEVNPNYDALVSSIAAGTFDGAVGDIAIVTSRTRLVDFTQPYAESGLVVVSRVKAMNSGAWSFLRPFSLNLWAACLAAFLFIGIVVWILEHRINDDFRGPVKRQLITIVWFSFSTLFSSHRENTVSTLGRFVLITWLFIVLIINSSYTASLTSILTVQQLYSPIKGLESLKRGNDPIGYQVGSFVEGYLMNGLGIEKSRLRAMASLDEYADALRLGPQRGGVAAVVDERPYIDLFLSSQCDFRIVGQEYSKSGWGFVSTFNENPP